MPLLLLLPLLIDEALVACRPELGDGQLRDRDRRMDRGRGRRIENSYGVDEPIDWLELALIPTIRRVLLMETTIC